MFSAPGESDDGEIIVIAFLLNAAEVVPQLAICEKEAQPFAFVALAVVIQYLFNVHGTLPVYRIENGLLLMSYQKDVEEAPQCSSIDTASRRLK